jgi:hypothetical protein
MSYPVLPVFNTDFAAALKALEIAAFGFDMPELNWGPENFKELSRDLQTCSHARSCWRFSSRRLHCSVICSQLANSFRLVLASRRPPLRQET